MATVSQALAIALQHHQAGRLQLAEQIYRQVLAAESNNADAIHLLGVIAAQLGKPEMAAAYIERAIVLKGNSAAFHSNLGGAYHALGKISAAVDCYRRALRLDSNYPEAHNNLGNALKDQGKLEEAVACYRRALTLKPDYPEAHNNLGVVRKEQGKLDEAIACCRRALALKPDYPEACNNLGNALKDFGRLDEAIACCRQALELKPDLAEAHNNLGNALKDQGKLDEAAACYRRALQLKPDYALAYGNLGGTLIDQGQLDEAVACCRRALELKPDLVEAHNNLGNALKNMGKFDEAIASYRRALEFNPNYAGAHYNLGTAWEAIGDLQTAEAGYRAALRHDPRLVFAYHKLAGLLGGRLPEEDLAAHRRLLEHGSVTGSQREVPDDQRLFLHFGLAHVLDGRGEYAEAARHLERGNALQAAYWRKRGQEYGPQAYQVLVDRMIAVCTPIFFQRVRGFGLESEIPVFVVGLPRSGTTLIEQILAAHGQVFGAGEVPLAGDTMAALGEQGVDSIEGLGRLDRETAQRLASRHLERILPLAPAARRIVDKMPDNYFLLGLLAALFPRAKLIHCRRDLRDVAVSCWMTRFEEVRWANDQQHIAARFRDYLRLMEHWRKVLPVPLLEVDYEETVADVEGVARRLVAWCGLDWDPQCLEFHRTRHRVTTASSVQVRQPVFRTSVERWKHYEGALAPLFAQLPSPVPLKEG